MSRISMKVCFPVAIAVAAALGASSASASWTTNGAGNFAASPGVSTNTGSMLTLGGGFAITCTTSGATGRLAASQASGNGLATIAPLFTGCKVGSFVAAVRCATAALNAVSYSAPTTTSVISAINCRIVLPGLGCGEGTNISSGFVVTGGIANATYGNTSQQLTLPTTGQTLTATYPAACSSGSPQPATFSNASGGAMIYSVTSTFRPGISNP